MRGSYVIQTALPPRIRRLTSHGRSETFISTAEIFMAVRQHVPIWSAPQNALKTTQAIMK